MVFKNVLRNKSLAEIKENCTLEGRSYCDVLTCYMVYPVGLSGNLQHPLSPPPFLPSPFYLLRKETLGTKYLYIRLIKNILIFNFS